ncbi:hypothetical protein ACCO45_002266 [Purpureocillium lilacinum]|uniref:Uncharacterized protein n=1 Tax=Purpureocillium lilacinum TaxID=33203 RepID=A0ACC4EAJ7_PURLI
MLSLLLTLTCAVAHVSAQASSSSSSSSSSPSTIYYRITISNESGRDGTYSVFLQPPEVTGGGSDVFAHAWVTAFVQTGGSVDVRTTSDWYAWAGKAPQYPAPGVRITGGVSRMAQIGSSGVNGSTFEMRVVNDAPTLIEVLPEATAGAYEIITGDDMPNPNEEYLVGLGKMNDLGVVTVAASVLAHNMDSVMVVPAMRFYVSASEHMAGEIVDLASVAGEAAEVDFGGGAGRGGSFAVVTHTGTGTGAWDISYEAGLTT